MMRALYSGVTGLRNHQTRMDVIGNNIANVNTAGYKASRVVFQDIYCQTIKPATSSSATTGGSNPQQVGLGMAMASIDVLHTSSASQYTGRPMDCAIEGDGYFCLGTGPVTGTESITFSRSGNFYTDKANYLTSANGEYILGYEVNSATGAIVKRDAGGTIDPAGNPTMQRIQIPANLKDVSIDDHGAIVGLDASNNKVYVGQIILATFNNENALEKVGSNTYRDTINSGAPDFTTPGAGDAGTLNPGSLEMSNVDLAGEFTDMIVTQRGFQANSRIISTTDSMLEELVNLKR
jgi:flagellar hook protein FlgE